MKIITCNNNDIKINSYVLIQNQRAIAIDPYDFDEVEAAIGSNTLDFIFLTHEHFDHIAAVDKLRATHSPKVVAQEITNQNIQSPRKNLSKFSKIILDYMQIEPKEPVKAFSISPADIVFKDDFQIDWQGHRFFFKHTPGHSSGSTCIYSGGYLFAGDSVFECCETDIKGPGASKQDYEAITIPFLKSLDTSMQVFAGHYRSFVLKDKLNAKQKAISIFKKRPKYTNCFVNYNGFISLLDSSEFFVRDNDVFILQGEKNFYRFYYYLEDYKNLIELDDFFKIHNKDVVLEIVSNTNVESEYYKAIGFAKYKTYSRYFKSPHKKIKKLKHIPIELAANEDIEEIKSMIDDTFDPICDYIPSTESLKSFVEKNEVYMVKVENEIAGVAIYEKFGESYYFRLSCVHKKHRNGFIGYLLASISTEDSMCRAWIDDNNDSAIKLNKGTGYEADGLKNHIFVKDYQEKRGI